MIYSLTVYLEDGVKESCSESFVIFAEKYLWESLLKKEVALCRASISFKRSTPPNMIC